MKQSYLNLYTLILFSLWGGCDSLTTPEITSQIELQSQGSSSLPTINGVVPDFSFLTFKKSKKDSDTFTSVIDKDQLLNFAKELEAALSYDFVAVFGNLDSTGQVFNYSYARLNFDNDLLLGYTGEKELFFYTVGDEENGIQKIAFAWIPNLDEAKQTFFNWVLPRYKGYTVYPNFEDEKRNKFGNDIDCEWVQTVPGGYIYYFEYDQTAKYFSPSYEYQCTDDIYNGGGSSGESTGGGGSTTYNWDLSSNDYSIIYVIDMKRIPCPGNPIKYPRIAPQTNSGIQGGREGMTRSNNTQYHSGLDILNPYNSPIFSPFDGQIVSTGYDSNLGNYVTMQFSISGSTYTIQFGHLQESDSFLNGKYVKAGDIIGSQGNSGNLEDAINKGYCASHTHIITRKKMTASWNISTYTVINPETILTTKYNTNGTPVNSTDC